MKKIVLLIAVLFLSGLTYGQATWTKYNKVEGRHNQMVKGDSSAVNVYLMSGGSSGDLQTKPYLSFIRSTDTWGAAADTSTYDFANNYLRCYVTIYDSSATADTLTIEVYSYAKLGWTTQMIGFEDVVTGYREADNTTVIVSGTIAKKYEITKLRPGNVRVRPKTVVGRSAYKTKRIVWEGIN